MTFHNTPTGSVKNNVLGHSLYAPVSIPESQNRNVVQNSNRKKEERQNEKEEKKTVISINIQTVTTVREREREREKREHMKANEEMLNCTPWRTQVGSHTNEVTE